MGTRMKNGVVVDGHSGRLCLAGEAVAARKPEELRALYVVHSGGEVTATDDEFYVALFDDELWVLPVETPGLNQLLFGTWYDQLCSSQRVHQATLDEIPRAWRRRWLGLLPLPQACLGCHPASDLPEWEVSEPLNFAELPRPTLEAVDHV